MRLLLLLACLILVRPNDALLPNQPTNPFGSARASQPQPAVAWSFRQEDCANGVIGEDMGSTLAITRNPASAGCPSRSGNSLTWSNAIVGASITNVTARNSLTTGPIMNNFSAIASDPGSGNTKSMTIELWFTVDSPPSGNEEVLFEIGDPSGSSTTLGSGSDAYQIKISYKRRQDTGPDYFPDLVTFNYIYASGTTSISENNSPNPLSILGFNVIGNSSIYSAGTVYSLYATVDTTATTTIYLGATGQSLAIAQSSGGPSVRYFPINSSSILRLGSTRSYLAGTLEGFPGTIQFAAIYNTALTQAQVTALIAGGLPNSLPVVKPVTFVFNEEASGNVNLNQPSIVFDVNGDAVTGFRIKTLPTQGTLSYGASAITAPDTPVADVSQLSFVSSPGGFSSSDGSCTTTYANFTFVATDGICDRSGLPSSAPTCNSPVAGIATLCVKEVNHAPFVTPTGPVNVLAEVNNAYAITITCRDKDVNLTAFGLKQVHLLTQTRSDLGLIYYTSGGTGLCTGGTEFTNIPSTQPILPLTPASNVSGTIQLCYIGLQNTNPVTNFGTDVISYQCEDNAAAFTPGSVSVNVYNPLNAGCGDGSSTLAQWLAGITCRSVGAKNNNVDVRLYGNDSVGTHTLTNRQFRIETLPPPSQGVLRLKSDNSLVTAGQVINANVGTGDVILSFQPATNFFNAMCALNTNPLTITPATCSSTTFVYQDGLGNGLNGCTSSSGCPVTFSYSMLYHGVPPTASAPATAEIVILAVNSPGSDSFFAGPSSIVVPINFKDYSVVTFTNTVTNATFQYNDPDGDFMRVGFKIQTTSSNLFWKVPGSFYNPDIDGSGERPRVDFTDGSDCLTSGTIGGGIPCLVTGKAYPSDLNRLLGDMVVTWVGSLPGNASIQVFIWDPVDQPNEFRVLFTKFDTTLPANATVSLGVQYNPSIAAAASALFPIAPFFAAFGATVLLIVLLLLAFSAYSRHRLAMKHFEEHGHFPRPKSRAMRRFTQRMSMSRMSLSRRKSTVPPEVIVQEEVIINEEKV